jgi:hypothetical protein
MLTSIDCSRCVADYDTYLQNLKAQEEYFLRERPPATAQYEAALLVMTHGIRIAILMLHSDSVTFFHQDPAKVLVLVSGTRKPLNTITPEDQVRMNNEEYVAYYNALSSVLPHSL